MVVLVDWYHIHLYRLSYYRKMAAKRYPYSLNEIKYRGEFTVNSKFSVATCSSMGISVVLLLESLLPSSVLEWSGFYQS